MSSIPPVFTRSEFRKANRSNADDQCVCVARRDGWVELRDDKTTFGATDDHRLVFTAEEFDTYLTAERQDSPATTHSTSSAALEIVPHTNGNYRFRRHGGTIELEFTPAELTAFRDGVANHEFDTPAYTG